MSAEFVDALKGYEYYIKERGETVIEDVNNYLIAHGRRQIQARTYNHYRKLLAHGFRSYIPINQFDVFQALGKIQMAADRRRYQREKTHISAKVSRDGENWRDALIVDKSLVGFGLTTPEKFPISKGSKIWVKMDNHDDIPGILVWRKHDQENVGTEFGLRAFEFIAKYQLIEEDVNRSRLTGILQISREQEGVLVWDNIYRVMEKTNELLDSVNSLVYSIGDVLHSEVSIARPVLLSIRFGSPGELQTKVDFGVAEIIRVLIEKFQFWSLEKKKYIEENRKRELENINYGLEVARNAINLRNEAVEAGMTDEAVATILEPVRSVFNAKKLPKGLFEEGTLERGILTGRIIPVVAELVSGDDPDFKLEAYKSNKGERKKSPLRQKRNRPSHSKK